MLRRKPLKTSLQFASLALPLIAPAALAASPVFPAETMFEAELGAIGTPWSVRDAATAGGQKYVVAGGPSPVALPAADAAAELSYTIQIDHTTDYKIWLRIHAPHGAADSFYWAIDGKPYQGYFPSAGPDWKWWPITANLTKGTHELKIKYREQNMGIDRLLVTAQPYFIPQGLGSDPGLPIAMPTNPYPEPPILPPSGHPRLFARAADVDRIRQIEQDARLQSNIDANPEYKAMNAAWTRLRKAADDNTTGTLPPQGASTTAAHCKNISKSIQGKALRYLVDGHLQSGQHAVSMMVEFLDLDLCQSSTSYRTLGETINLSAIVYDWCWPLLTAVQKQLFIQRFTERAARTEIGFPPSKQGVLSGHGAEQQVLRDQLGAGIAFYDEAPEVYRIAAGRLFSEFVPARDFAAPSHAHHQGTSYGPYRYTWDMFGAWIMRRMGGGELFASEQRMIPYQWLYMRRPDGQLMRDGDAYQTFYRQGQYWAEPRAAMMSANFYGDGILKNEYAKNQLAFLNHDEDLYLVLMNDPAIKPAPQALPLTKYFADPAGYMVARTAWTDSATPDYASNAVVATMKVGAVQFEGHQHLDAGHFQLYYKGALAIDSGIYEGKNLTVPADVGYGSSHDINYHKRTVAHNAMLVLDPNETFKERFPATVSNDGGQRFIGPEPFNLDALLSTANPSKSYVVGATLRQQVGPDSMRPDYSYLKGDLAKAYTAKIAAYTRSFVFLNLKDGANPAALLVLDKVRSSDAGFKKSWLLHSIQQPVVDGDTTTIERTVSGLYNGKLVNRTLYPAGARITKVGGAGQEFAVHNPKTLAYDNYPMQPVNTTTTEEPGAWRIEVSPPVPSHSDLFLNVMQVLDAGGQVQPLAAEAVASEQMAGAQIGNRVVLFSKEEADIADSASFTLAAGGAERRVLVTDLSPGFWSVSANGGAATVEHEVVAGQGTLYFVAPAAGGTFSLTRAAFRSLPAPAAVPSL